MSLSPGMVCLISGGRPENLGKIVFIVGNPEDPRLPDLGGHGRAWDVQMVSQALIGPNGEDYLQGKIGSACLTPLDFTMEAAREMREVALRKIVEQAMTEMLKEDWWGESAE